MKRIILPALAILAVVVASGCTTIEDTVGDAIPQDKIHYIEDLPLGNGATVSDCNAGLKRKVPDAVNYDCEITRIDTDGGTFDCTCRVHTGII